MKTMVIKQRKLKGKEIKHERQAIPSLVEMGHHALACGSTSLGWGGAMAQWRWRRGSGWLERQRCLKASTGSITVCKGKVF